MNNPGNLYIHSATASHLLYNLSNLLANSTEPTTHPSDPHPSPNSVQILSSQTQIPQIQSGRGGGEFVRLTSPSHLHSGTITAQ